MNKNAQINAIAFLFAIVGAAAGWVMAAGMNSGIIMKIIIALLTGTVCYFVVNAMSS